MSMYIAQHHIGGVELVRWIMCHFIYWLMRVEKLRQGKDNVNWIDMVAASVWNALWSRLPSFRLLEMECLLRIPTSILKYSISFFKHSYPDCKIRNPTDSWEGIQNTKLKSAFFSWKSQNNWWRHPKHYHLKQSTHVGSGRNPLRIGGVKPIHITHRQESIPSQLQSNISAVDLKLRQGTRV